MPPNGFQIFLILEAVYQINYTDRGPVFFVFRILFLWYVTSALQLYTQRLATDAFLPYDLS
jgi:hypothetical protein